jgi:hypothetical protein
MLRSILETRRIARSQTISRREDADSGRTHGEEEVKKSAGRNHLCEVGDETREDSGEGHGVGRSASRSLGGLGRAAGRLAASRGRGGGTAGRSRGRAVAVGRGAADGVRRRRAGSSRDGRRWHYGSAVSRRGLNGSRGAGRHNRGERNRGHFVAGGKRSWLSGRRSWHGGRRGLRRRGNFGRNSIARAGSGSGRRGLDLTVGDLGDGLDVLGEGLGANGDSGEDSGGGETHIGGCVVVFVKMELVIELEVGCG